MRKKTRGAIFFSLRIASHPLHALCHSLMFSFNCLSLPFCDWKNRFFFRRAACAHDDDTICLFWSTTTIFECNEHTSIFFAVCARLSHSFSARCLYCVHVARAATSSVCYLHKFVYVCVCVYTQPHHPLAFGRLHGIDCARARARAYAFDSGKL